MRDLRLALRTIAGHKWFSLAVVATLAVGIGINATVFTLSGAVLFKPLPFRDAERIVVLTSRNPSQNIQQMNLSAADFLEFRAQTTSFEHLEAVSNGAAVISEIGRPPERFLMASVTSGFFRAFRTDPVVGRGFGTADEAASEPAVAVIGYNVWKNRYNLDAGVVGRSVRLNETATTIVGVMPQGFGLPELQEVWVPLTFSATQIADRKDRRFLVFGLVKPGVAQNTARADVAAVALRLQTAYPDTNKGIEATALTFHERFVGGKGRTVFSLMLGAVGLVLLIACANVANMMLSRGIGRQRELTIRAALGASRWRIIRLLLVESLLLSVAGGLVALFIAALGVPAFDRALANAGKPSWIVFSVDYTVMGYVALVCVLSTLLFGLAPALRSSRVDLRQALQEGGRGGSGRVGWLSATLVVLQFTFAVVLLTAAGLLMRSFVAGQDVNPGVPRAQIMTGRVELPSARYPDKEARQRFFARVEERLAALPGVTQSALASTLPALGGPTGRIELDGRLVSTPADRPSVRLARVSDAYLDAIALPLVRGRGFEERDGTPGHEVAIVSRTFAARFWPNEDAVGKRFRFNAEQSPDPWLTVVGVSGDLVQSTQEAAPEAVAFTPYRQADPSSLVLTLRTSGDASSLANPLRAAVQEIDRDLAVAEVDTLDRLLYNQHWPYRVFGALFGIFALSALLMAAVGLYAVMSQATGRRTREIGIRMALGATPSRILASVMRRGALQLGIGLALGTAAAFGLTGQMQTLLLGVLPNDPVVFATTASVLTLVGLFACWLPARRAALIPPVHALGQDEPAR